MRKVELRDTDGSWRRIRIFDFADAEDGWTWPTIALDMRRDDASPWQFVMVTELGNDSATTWFDDEGHVHAVVVPIEG